MEYKVTVDIPYEGEYSFYTCSLDEVKAFIRTKSMTLDDITVEVVAATLDIYELARGL